VAELTEYVNRLGWELVGVYEDTMTGAKAQRPGLDAMMADARQRRIDAVVVMKLDRFGRSLVNCIAGIQELTTAGVRFIATSQGIDTDAANPTSRLLLRILVGRPRRVFDRQRALDMRQQGMSYPAIARALGIGYGTVVREIDGLSKKRAATASAGD
jgi:DNA invertase Pin-like site-specific DNA recombinase